MFKLIVFDMDGTLAPSKGQMDQEMVQIFKNLLLKFKVGIISGGDYSQFQKQVIPFLGDDEKLLQNLYICPTCSTKMYTYSNGNWNKLYSLDFSDDEKDYIIKVFNKAIDDLELRPKETWGDLIEDRGTQITYSALGQKAPLEFKETGDPNQEKRKRIRNYLLKDLQNYNILIGGSTSIDITRQGVDKAYGIQKLRETTNIDLNNIIFVGDAVFPGGNDYPPLDKLGITTKKVFSINDTKNFIRNLLSD